MSYTKPYVNGHEPPPTAIDAERGFIGSLLLAPDNSTRARLAPSDLWDYRNQTMYGAILDMERAGIPIDATTLTTRLGDDYVHSVVQCLEACGHVSRVDHYAEDVIGAAKRRRKIEECQRIIAAARDMSKPFMGDGVAEIKFHSGPELANLDTTIKWLVAGVLVAAQGCLNAAPKKTLKTNSLIDLVISLATATPFLGRFQIPEAVRAGIMSAESGSGTIKETANRIAKSKGFDGVRDCPGALFAFETPTITTADECYIFEKIITENELECLVIDPTYLTFLIGDEGKNIFRMGQLLSPLNKIIQRTGCTIILSHHSKKAAGKDGEPLELGDESYSGFSEWARQWLYLSRREPYDEGNPGSHRLWLRYGGSVGHAGLVGLDIEEGSHKHPNGRIWQVITVDANAIREDRQDARIGRREEMKNATFEKNLDKARKAIATFPEGCTQNDVATKARISKDIAKSCLYELLALNEVEECELTKAGRTLDGWKPTGTSGTKSCPTGTVPVDSEWDTGTTTLV